MRHIIALSGGKDSTALAIYLRDRIENPEYYFADTGREPPELYEFLDALEEYLGEPIERLHAGIHCFECDEITLDPTASKCSECGEPLTGNATERDFDYYIDRWGNEDDGPYLPSPKDRFCTREFKIRPTKRFIRDGAVSLAQSEAATIYVGLRADEPMRKGTYGITAEQIEYKHPFVEDGIELNDVMAILNEAELPLPGYYKWRSTGGCWNCFYQKKSDWEGLKEYHPDLFEQALEEENQSANHTYNATFNLQQIQDQIELPMSLEREEEIWQGSTCKNLICGK